jgi:hypothetical protein
MSLLEYHARPLVAFDAANKEHRRHYYNFLDYGGWGTCPVRFIVPDSNGLDLVSVIQRSLNAYYVNKEFKVVQTRSRRKK